METQGFPCTSMYILKGLPYIWLVANVSTHRNTETSKYTQNYNGDRKLSAHILNHGVREKEPEVALRPLSKPAPGDTLPPTKPALNLPNSKIN